MKTKTVISIICFVFLAASVFSFCDRVMHSQYGKAMQYAFWIPLSVFYIVVWELKLKKD